MAQPDMRVTHYKLNWNLQDGLGTVELISSNGVVHETLELIGLDYHNYFVIVDMLRNERPVYYDRLAEELYTDPEMVGGEEG